MGYIFCPVIVFQIVTHSNAFVKYQFKLNFKTIINLCRNKLTMSIDILPLFFLHVSEGDSSGEKKVCIIAPNSDAHTQKKDPLSNTCIAWEQPHQ